jgi:hypothetical protein
MIFLSLDSKPVPVSQTLMALDDESLHVQSLFQLHMRLEESFQIKQKEPWISLFPEVPNVYSM